jgi:deoxyribodipyrimidine photolyase-related protein
MCTRDNTAAERDTLWILGDQLDAQHPGLRLGAAGHLRILMIESDALLNARRYHRQRLHLVLCAMRRYANELRERGFTVDYRRAASFRAGLAAHRREHEPRNVLAAEPTTHGMRALLERSSVRMLRHERFLCHYDEFRSWAADRTQLRMDAFYRERRKISGYLMDGDQPAGAAYSFDQENREPPPRQPIAWPEPLRDPLDAIDLEVLRSLPANGFGADPDGTWASSRTGARKRLEHFIAHVLPRFGPHQDAMLSSSWHLAHSLLSPYLNLGLLHPKEVCHATEAAYRAGRVPIASAEGFLRQVLGWREYIWGSYWLFGKDYGARNALSAKRALLPLYEQPARTQMRCVRSALDSVEQHGYAHHIQRLMVLGNLGLLAGVRPRALSDWMQVSFVDGGEWVMWPNVIGMALFADGGRLSTKPYAAGGAYIGRMSDACRGCVYRPKQRVGDRACPFTTLYWSFFGKHGERFAKHPRVRLVVQAFAKLPDRERLEARARSVLRGLERGEI